ncbi:MAG: glycoside hydrolase [Acidobacteria bacterium]|nr:glycoside hydrolase [Acidobacteriota bacterium]
MTRVAILWHMHQPFYEDPATGEHILPWVRMHALKDYLGMVAILHDYPAVKLTFNLVPSLLVQLEAFAEDRARDRSLDLGLKPAELLDHRDGEFIVGNFFHAQRQRMIDPYPRYAELLAKRGDWPPAGGDPRSALERFTVEDLRDLQVWHKLAWLDPVYLEGDPRVSGLVAKGRAFSEDDKALLRRIELEILKRVIPEYKDAAARGQIEISTSPFYHPILPLLCDTNVYQPPHSGDAKPPHRFVHPEDASEQLARAVACHERLFGRRPVGLWPSEGSVSDAMVPLVARAGFTWMATDELILARTLGKFFSRDGHGHLEQPEHVYAPYVVSAGGARVACAFRDHVLSDLIGFTYAGWPSAAAAADFVSRLVEAGRRYRQRTGGGDALIPIILDGENAWEHFEGGGRPFLRALYERLSTESELQTVTMADACVAADRELPGIFPGSWIDASFSIWIEHRDDQQAWSQLAEAHVALDTSSADAPTVALAREEVLIAEGSDWFWWYGDEHSSAHDAEFDDLFRRHLRSVYSRLGQAIPDDLFVSNISTGRGAQAPRSEPLGLQSPTLDGEETSFLEWLGAVRIDAQDPAPAPGGTMHQGGRMSPRLTRLWVGLDRERLFVRLDAAQPIAEFLRDGREITLQFLEPSGVRFVVRLLQDRLTWSYWDRAAVGQPWVERPGGGARASAGSILELSIPFADLAGAPGQVLTFFTMLSDRNNRDVERHPAGRPAKVTVPDEGVHARGWRV